MAAGVAATTAAACAIPVVAVGSAEVASALTAWPTPAWAIDLGAVALAFAVAACVARCRRLQVRAAGRRRLGGERSGGCDRGGGDRKRRGRLVGCGCSGSCRCRRGGRDGDGNGVGRHHGRSILRCLGLILCRGTSSPEACLVSSDFASDFAASAFDLATAGRFGLAGRCRPLRLLWHRLWRRRVPWPRRRGRWNRCARLCQMLPCPMRRCRARGCRMLLANRPSGAGRALSPERDCRCCWRPHCCRPAPRNCRFWQIDRNPAVLTSPARPEKTRLPILLT